MKTTAKLLLLFVRYGYEDYPESANEIIEHFNNICSDVTVIGIENNTNEPILNSCKIKANFIYGDNRFNEFSAWNTALNNFDLKNFDIVILATSAYKKNYKGGMWSILNNISNISLEFILKNQNCIIGQLDNSDQSLDIHHTKFDTWLRSNLIIFPSNALLNLNLYNESLFYNCLSIDSIFEAVNSSQSYRDYVLRWLSGDSINNGRWSTIYKINTEMKSKKIMMVIFEHLLSIRLRNLGFKLIDIVTIEKAETRDSLFNASELQQIEYRRNYYPDS